MAATEFEEQTLVDLQAIARALNDDPAQALKRIANIIYEALGTETRYLSNDV
jgi:hypothetical protein